jgi:hypothetical protein
VHRGGHVGDAGGVERGDTCCAFDGEAALDTRLVPWVVPASTTDTAGLSKRPALLAFPALAAKLRGALAGNGVLDNNLGRGLGSVRVVRRLALSWLVTGDTKDTVLRAGKPEAVLVGREDANEGGLDADTRETDCGTLRAAAG